MTPSPIRRVLSVLRKHRVRALLMGGQACILYGAAEFSRVVDVAVLGSHPGWRDRRDRSDVHHGYNVGLILELSVS